MTIQQANIAITLSRFPTLHAIHLENTGPTGKTFQRWHLTIDDQKTVCGFLVSDCRVLAQGDIPQADCRLCYGQLYLSITDEDRAAMMQKEKCP